mmetsp:Transcript_25087/g.36167  ORF Transcript_25087/g.36167 Transcript_25087/m.36167 type:complete len:108 (+) Transcript_25087:2260-2583(+)
MHTEKIAFHPPVASIQAAPEIRAELYTETMKRTINNTGAFLKKQRGPAGSQPLNFILVVVGTHKITPPKTKKIESRLPKSFRPSNGSGQHLSCCRRQPLNTIQLPIL